MWRWVLAAVLVALSAGLALFAMLLVHLDQEVRTRFAGVRWVLPAQVYAQPLEVYPGDPIGMGELRHELDRLGYRAADDLVGPGTYVAAKGLLRVDTRAFAFWDGPQEERRVEIRGDEHAISGVRPLGSDESLDLLRFEPALIGSIYPSRSGEDRVMVKLAEVPKLL
ncbi:MAG TPA: penicillin-binding protein 1B, partial [Nevskia sp.]|nr:penicillin-binding protein 1B [Nevskia sp.]